MNAKDSAERKQRAIAAARAASNSELAAASREKAAMGPSPRYLDVDRAELERQAEIHIRAGRMVFFKLTCQGCGDRISIDQPNMTCDWVRHDDGCGYNNRFLKGGFAVVAMPTTGDDLGAMIRAMFGEDMAA